MIVPRSHSGLYPIYCFILHATLKVDSKVRESSVSTTDTLSVDSFCTALADNCQQCLGHK